MAPTLGPNESVLWKGRAIASIRGVMLTVLFFFGIGLAAFGILGVILAFFSFLLFIFTLILTISSFASLRNVRYYITNQRLVREQGVISKRSGELSLDHLASTRLKQDFLNKIRGLGTIYFGSSSGPLAVFQRIMD